jgi:hypothetical protein
LPLPVGTSTTLGGRCRSPSDRWYSYGALPVARVKKASKVIDALQ